MALAKGLRPLQVFLMILIVRVASIFLVQTWFVPDEYWQTLEVAHKHVFGYGYLTWEWKKGIRSFLYPGIVSALYAILKFTGLDYPEAVILLPRVFQASLSAVADYRFYKWTGSRKWALFLILTSWFWFYTANRTLLQTVETVLVIIGLSVFPFKAGKMGYYDKENNSWVWLAVISVFIRPTSAPIWLVLGLYNLFTTNQGKWLILQKYLPISIIGGGSLVALDSYYYGELIITPWEFFKYNILHDVSSYYGTHPWYWYVTEGMPAILGVSLPLVLWGIYTVLRRPKQNTIGVVLLAAVALHLAVHSCIPHKEVRFVLPLIPILLYIAQDVVVPWSRKAKNWQLYSLATLLVVGNAFPAGYFGLVHQRGPLPAMTLLRDVIPHNRTTVLFMMPCHSMPLYSHLHMNITARFLDCSPPPTGFTCESDTFYINPTQWWRQEYSDKQLPDFIVLFDVLRGRVESLLRGYQLMYQVPHSQFGDGEVGKNIIIMEREQRRAAGAQDV
ncbi:GPI mannosyltransferase 3 [Colias croceus]|uniref:GPI mannosyltransferase 3 n=1 Tax=Colias crocea TaxID=72248 RepID=UPI001E27FAEC|nr:GPI mannosyltransferase 3 [Colias croceus]